MMKQYFHPHYVNLVITRFSMIFWKIINQISALWWGVRLGRNCKFRGKSIWRLLPNSRIIIHDNCIFNSNHRSNLIGIYSPCIFSTIQRGSTITIGQGCGFSGTVIGCANSITLGRNVRCGANTLITDTDWHEDDPRVGCNQPVVIEDNVWLGYGVKVLKGVRIGENSIIGACSIVTKDIPANVIAAGNPCKVLKVL